MSDDTGKVVKYIVLVVVIAVLAIALNDWDPSAPTVTGYTQLQTTLTTDPFNGTENITWPNWYAYTNASGSSNGTYADCSGFSWIDPGMYNCQVTNFVAWFVDGVDFFVGAFAWLFNTLWTGLLFVWSFLVWLAALVFNFFVALLGTATLTMDGMPLAVQAIMWAVALPLLAMLIMLILRFIRGQS
jgi:hypothetical protein